MPNWQCAVNGFRPMKAWLLVTTGRRDRHMKKAAGDAGRNCSSYNGVYRNEFILKLAVEAILIAIRILGGELCDRHDDGDKTR